MLFIFAAVAVAAILMHAPQPLVGAAKEGGPYKVLSDSLTAAGAAGVVGSGSAYRLVYSVGQAAASTMTGGSYTLEGGFVSGLEAVFVLDAAVDETLAPPLYSGNPDDPVPGSLVTFKLEFVNHGEAGVNTIVETEPLPAQLDFATSPVSLIFNNVEIDPPPCVIDNRIVTCEIGQEVAVGGGDDFTAAAAGATGAVTVKTIIR